VKAIDSFKRKREADAPTDLLDFVAEDAAPVIRKGIDRFTRKAVSVVKEDVVPFAQIVRKHLLPPKSQEKPEDILYRAIHHAEHRGNVDTTGLSNQIRTMDSRKPGSSAYGEVQILGTTMTDMINRYNRANPTGSALELTQKEKDFGTRFAEQAKAFIDCGGLDIGNEECKVKAKKLNIPVAALDYGGGGWLNTPEDTEIYRGLVRKLMKQSLDDNQGDMFKTAVQWRYGRNTKRNDFTAVNPAWGKRQQADPDYEKAMNKFLISIGMENWKK